MARLYYILELCVWIVQLQRFILAQPGFVSIDCGGSDEPYTDNRGITWVPDKDYVLGGLVSDLSEKVLPEWDVNHREFRRLRYFPTDETKKHCYVIGGVDVSRTYLVRASFLYQIYDGASIYPRFRISLNTSPWATVTIVDPSKVYFEEVVTLATEASFSVCFYGATTGSPFVSTIEIRPTVTNLNSVSIFDKNILRQRVRINFGAQSLDPIRFPQDAMDRIWVSDKVFPFVAESPGTHKLNTSKRVDVNNTNHPPEAVMQTAAVGGTRGLSYSITLEGYPAYSTVAVYFAEIQELKRNEIRAFTYKSNINDSTYDGVPLNLAKDWGAFRTFVSGYPYILIPDTLDIDFLSVNSSSLPPLMNAIEIYEVLERHSVTSAIDVAALSSFAKQLLPMEVVGDPCLPEPWAFITCTSDAPPRVSSIKLSSQNLTGSIPTDIRQMTELVNLWLDDNKFTGSIPDLSALTHLQTLHLQHNQLAGDFPSSLGRITGLKELFLNNNNVSGAIPADLLKRAGITIRAEENPYLCANLSCYKDDSNMAPLIGGILSGVVLVISLGFLIWRRKKGVPRKTVRFPFRNHFRRAASDRFHHERDFNGPSEGARVFDISELIEATEDFGHEIGAGGFGRVYHGKLKDGQEIAVKVLSSTSTQGEREFNNEVNLLCRVHHRNLVILIGYCFDLKERMLVYEYMHRGNLRDYLYGPRCREQRLSWIARLNIALDSAKGLEYLHSGCIPSIIHRDVKSSNILLTEKFVAKVADFGLSKLTSDETTTTISTNVKGTVGYLDPEYFSSQQLTTKSDVYSFGVVLLEVIAGREPVVASQRSNPDAANIVNWTKNLLNRSDVHGIVDPALELDTQKDSVWKLLELAVSCVEPQRKNRPTMAQVVLELTDIITMEGTGQIYVGTLNDVSLARSPVDTSIVHASPDYSETIPLSGPLVFDRSMDEPSPR